MIDKQIWVEVDSRLVAVRIFKNRKAAFDSGVLLMPRFRWTAVAEIRSQIFLRSKGACELCGTPITEQSGHMHEQKHRGKGGDISLENSVMICSTCHRRAHADREPKFTRRQS